MLIVMTNDEFERFEGNFIKFITASNIDIYIGLIYYSVENVILVIFNLLAMV